MKEYKENGKVYEITLDNGKVVKCSSEWVKKSMKALDTDLEDVLLMFLEDNDYLENEEQKELDNKAKTNKVKQVVKSDKPRAKTTRERKPNPTKEMLISTIAKALENVATDVIIENVGKIITCKVDGKDFKIDLTEKRVKKSAWKHFFIMIFT